MDFSQITHLMLMVVQEEQTQEVVVDLQDQMLPVVAQEVLELFLSATQFDL